MDERNSYPFVMSRMGSVRMELHSQFRNKEYKKFGLRPVFRIQQEWAAARFEKKDEVSVIAGKPISGISYKILTEQEILEKNPKLPPHPSDEEIQEFLRIENEWMAEQILYKYGWDEFEKQCQIEHLSQEFHDKFTPCDSKNRQCHLLCPYINDITKCKMVFTISIYE